MSSAPKIALISAVTAAIGPAQDALAAAFPQAQVWNLLDDRLLSDADARGGLDADLRSRMNGLIGYALAGGADGVLLTCSLYGPVAQAFAADLPVLAPDEAAFADLAEAGHRRILVVASFAAAKDDSAARLRDALGADGAEVTGIAVPEAMAATKAGDAEGLVTALIGACRPLAAEVDAVFLAQYSLAPAGDRLQEALGVPVVSGPASSAAALRRSIAPEPS
ncbi:aspartate/glutamate racemase family protein [Glycomyces harbinensis]|uniref:Asp/Glu/Hydantoin racemase n=1 Tax=Glycomyces harbinensis TaxID=58114 RepID=A0A1G6W0M2_9ACTN|nr:aspartate/glutamate racemase family protein [Glycomyces harbinensis]SDD59500.1 hypothetical protein SAMN05216270_105244 [Glycomyces harbinensis]